jgi:hypothetical protein
VQVKRHETKQIYYSGDRERHSDIPFDDIHTASCASQRIESLTVGERPEPGSAYRGYLFSPAAGFSPSAGAVQTGINAALATGNKIKRRG